MRDGAGSNSSVTVSSGVFISVAQLRYASERIMRYNRLTTCNSISVGLRSSAPKEPAFAPKAMPTRAGAPSIPPPEPPCGRLGEPSRPKAGPAVGRWELAERDLSAAGVGSGNGGPQKRRKTDRKLPGERLIGQPHQLARHSLQLAADPELGLGQIGFRIRFHERLTVSLRIGCLRQTLYLAGT